MFHAKCDGYQGMLVVVKSNNSNVFGGYTEVDWSGYYQYKNDANAFLFSLVNSYNTSVKMSIIQPQYAIYASTDYGPVFGGGWDLYVELDGNYGYSNLGFSYQLPSFFTATSQQAQSFLAGSYKFPVVEVEVYSRISYGKLSFFSLFSILFYSCDH
jgi:hypothetical protein